MTFEASVVKVMIASPSDIDQERTLIRDAIHKWNAVHAEDRGTILLPIGWETNATPAMGDRPQEIINKQLLRGADLLIAMFWTRIGTPTGVAESGTVEEIQEHVGAGKPAMLYFSKRPVQLSAVQAPQWMALEKFKESILPNAFVVEYTSIEEFVEMLSRHLPQKIIQHFPAHSKQSTETFVSPYAIAVAANRPLKALSPEAQVLLKEAVHDPSGRVSVLQNMGGLSVSANGKNMLPEPKNARHQATWRSALRELVNEELFEQRDSKGALFAVTEKGYKAGEMLNE